MVTATVLLPDHLHAVWELPRGDADDSTRWRRIKSLFTRQWLAAEQGVWQRRFFEHTCRDDDDLKRCADYTHVNPLKHGLVTRVRDWPWSSFHRCVHSGEYPSDWGSAAHWYGDELRHAE